MKRINPRFYFLFFSLLFFSFRSADATIVREFQVGIAVSPSYKTTLEWQRKFEERLAYASKIFETYFKIGFRPIRYMDWNPADESDMDALFEDLKDKFPLNDFDLVIGLSSVKKLPPKTIHDPDIVGRSRPFSGYLVLRSSNDPLFRIQEETTLTHELGHLFGAIHVNQESSIMSPVIAKQIPTAFDPINQQIIELTRGVDFKRGDSSLDSGTIQQVLGAYLRMINEGQPFEFYYALGNLYLKLGQTDNALETWIKAAEINDNSGQIHYDLGVLYVKLGKPDEAINHLNRATSIFGASGNSSLKESAFHMLGNAYFDKKNYESAIYAWQEADVISPNDPDLKANMGLAQLKQKKYGDAVRLFERAIELGGNRATVYQGLAMAYLETGNYGKAVENFKQALSFASDKVNFNAVEVVQPAQIYSQMGYAFLQLGDSAQAAANFEAACKLEPSIDCHKHLGQIYYQLNRWDDAIREFSAILGSEKTDGNIYGMLGVALAQKNDYEKAAYIFEEALKNVTDRTEQAQFHANLGNLYLKAKKIDLASEQFRFSIDKNFNNAETHVGLAICYLQQNQFDSARESLRNALTIDPQNADAKNLLSQIEAHLGK